MSSSTKSPPYQPDTQGLGGTPNKLPDIPICAVFLVLYLVAGILMQKLLIQSKKMGRKFGFCGMMSGLCWIRLITLSLRIAWSFYKRNIRLGIAAQIFVNVGTVLLFFTNFFFTQRIIRAQHPHFGWTKFYSPITIILCAWTVLSVVAVIVVSIQSFYTESIHTRHIDHVVQIYVETAFSVIAALPLFMVLLSTAIRQIPSIKNKQTYDKFGAGSMKAKIILVCVTSAILAFANALKAGTSYGSPIPLTATTPWYFTRGVFYGLGLAPEIIVLYLYIIFKVNLRFVIPDGAKGPYSYAGGFTFAGETGNEKPALGNRDSQRNLVGSSPSLAQSNGGRSGRTSMSRTRESVISWGGIYHENTEPGIGEDGAEMVPYSNVENHEELGFPTAISGADQEMGWDAKSGRWKLRPISCQTAPGVEPVGAREDV